MLHIQEHRYIIYVFYNQLNTQYHVKNLKYISVSHLQCKTEYYEHMYVFLYN